MAPPRLVEEVGDHGLGGVVRDQRPVREDRAGLRGIFIDVRAISEPRPLAVDQTASNHYSYAF